MPKVNLANAASKRQEQFVKNGNTGNHKAVSTEKSISVDTARKKATFNMEEALHQRLKIAAVTQKRDMTELMEDAVREYLDHIGS
jgi:predicted HicB family RNase H-like nuclease